VKVNKVTLLHRNKPERKRKMSFKDLESSIKAQLAEFEAALRAKTEKQLEKEARKRRRKNAEKRGYTPEAPIRYQLEVTLNLREVKDGKLGDLLEVAFVIPTISEVEAELEAIRRAKLAGMIWRGTVSITRK